MMFESSSFSIEAGGRATRFGAFLVLCLGAACSGGSENGDAEGDAGAGALGGTAGSNTGGSGGKASGGSAGAGTSGKGGSSGSGAGGASGDAGAFATGGSAEEGGAGGASAGAGGSTGGSTTLACNPGALEVAMVNEGGDISIDGEEVEDSAAWVNVVGSRYYCAALSGISIPEERWVVAVENTGTSLLCDVELTPTFYDEAGAELFSLPAVHVYAPTHERPDESGPEYCFGPGERGYAVAVRAAITPTDVSTIAEVRYEAEGSVYSDAVPKSWVTLGDVEVVRGDDGTFATGVVTNGSSTITYWNVRVFLEDADGFPVGALEAPDTVLPVQPNQEFAFETQLFIGESASHVALVEHGAAL
jgi:hypothetical protein